MTGVQMSYSIGVDVGGTFTDLVIYNIETNSLEFAKTPSTLDNQAKGVAEGNRQLIDRLNVSPESIRFFIHGTTVATIEDNGTLNVPTGKLAINATAITSTAAELNILDGVTSTAAELNIMDGVTSTTAELNILDGVTSTAAELNIVDGNTSATSTTIADADRVVLNDNGTMVQAAVTDLKTYIE